MMIRRLKKWIYRLLDEYFDVPRHELNRMMRSTANDTYEKAVNKIRADYLSMRTDIDYLMSKLNKRPDTEPVKGSGGVDTEPVKDIIPDQDVNRDR